jgi:hypothetical protein
MAQNPSNMIGTSRTDGVSNKDIALKIFSSEVLTAFETKNIFLELVQSRTIANGKSASFPVIGAFDSSVRTHVPGTDVVADTIASGERVISIDDLKYASVFVDNYEEAMAHYEVRTQYSTEMGRKLAKEIDAGVISQLTACITATPAVGQPTVQGAAYGAGLLAADTDEEKGGKILKAIFKAQTELDSKDVPGERFIVVRPEEKYLLVNSNAVNKDYTNTNGGLDTGNVEMVAGLKILTSNNLAANQIIVGTENAVGVVKLLDLKTESNYDFNKLGYLMTSSYALGMGILNPGCVIIIDATQAEEV